jgi:LytS/YehU family sensor histidine kinase
MQDADDERQIGVTNIWKWIAAAGLAAAILLWVVLFAAYRPDRGDAIAVASMTVLLVIPPLASYYTLMELTKNRLSLTWQVVAVFTVGLIWVPIQRGIISPTFTIELSLGESVTNLILLPVFGIASWLGVSSFFYRQRLGKVLELQKQNELRLLEAQLAPHMLFNMLNTVYAVLLTDHEKAIPLFLSMSQALRHIVDRTRKRWIPLQEELDFIENYAVLERARNPERVVITIDADGDLDVPVPPMLLTTLFENAVKHGRFPDGTIEIRVHVRVTEARMDFEVANRFPVPGNAGKNMGIGHSNVKNRLDLIYPQRNAFHTYAEDGFYRASIAIMP